MISKLCTIEDCDRPFLAKGRCAKHYQYWRRFESSNWPRCSADGCVRVSIGKHGYCNAHYQRYQATGDVEVDKPLFKRQPNQGSHITKEGYVYTSKPLPGGGTKRILQHRLVMEEFLGRPLEADENIHHKNGNRSDNRLENLELWSKSQPPGQRVSDKIVWAKEILERYGDDPNEY